MRLLENSLYLEEVKTYAGYNLDWNRLSNSTVLITGATGMIGSFIIDLLMYHNSTSKLNCTILAIGRDSNKASYRFTEYLDSKYFKFISKNINEHFEIDDEYEIDYIIHAASNTHPIAYSTQPVSTVLTNIVGTNNLLDYSANHNVKRFVFVSSVEIYGENRGDIDRFDESYCGYIDCNTVRAGYPEGKRAGEALCQAYIREHGMNIVIPRLSRVYGPTMLSTDTKAISQFIINSVEYKDIILKSEGNQLYSYCYVADACIGVLYVLLNGENGQAYNVSNPESDITLKELASVLAECSERQVIFELPNEVERAGYSTATKATLNSDKLISQGWRAMTPISEGLDKTIKIIREISTE